MIRVNKRYKYVGPNLAYYGTSVLVTGKMEKWGQKYNEIKFGNGMIYGNVPDTHLKELNENNRK